MKNRTPRKVIPLKPLEIPLSKHQQTIFADLKAQADAIQARVNDCVTAIVASQVDPESVSTWNVVRAGDKIICLPPEEPKKA
jgi:hypothetical protein